MGKKLHQAEKAGGQSGAVGRQVRASPLLAQEILCLPTQEEVGKLHT